MNISENGTWSILLPPQSAGGPHILTFKHIPFSVLYIFFINFLYRDVIYLDFKKGEIQFMYFNMVLSSQFFLQWVN
jgi:hypothetical protein